MADEGRGESGPRIRIVTGSAPGAGGAGGTGLATRGIIRPAGPEHTHRADDDELRFDLDRPDDLGRVMLAILIALIIGAVIGFALGVMFTTAVLFAQ